MVSQSRLIILQRRTRTWRLTSPGQCSFKFSMFEIVVLYISYSLYVFHMFRYCQGSIYLRFGAVSCTTGPMIVSRVQGNVSG